MRVVSAIPPRVILSGSEHRRLKYTLNKEGSDIAEAVLSIAMGSRVHWTPNAWEKMTRSIVESEMTVGEFIKLKEEK